MDFRHGVCATNVDPVCPEPSRTASCHCPQTLMSERGKCNPLQDDWTVGLPLQHGGSVSDKSEKQDLCDRCGWPLQNER